VVHDARGQVQEAGADQRTGQQPGHRLRDAEVEVRLVVGDAVTEPLEEQPPLVQHDEGVAVVRREEVRQAGRTVVRLDHEVEQVGAGSRREPAPRAACRDALGRDELADMAERPADVRRLQPAGEGRALGHGDS
jgi:hypothetical protein